MYKLLLAPLLLCACLAEAEGPDNAPPGTHGKSDNGNDADDGAGSGADSGPPEFTATLTTEDCGPAAHTFSPDKLALTVLFDYASASRDDDGQSTALDCRAIAEYRTEPGWRLRLPHLDARGYADVLDADELRLQLAASFGNSTTTSLTHTFTAPYWDLFSLRVPAADDSTTRSSCDGIVRLELRATVNPTAANGPLGFQLDSLDTEIAWERCP